MQVLQQVLVTNGNLAFTKKPNYKPHFKCGLFMAIIYFDNKKTGIRRFFFTIIVIFSLGIHKAHL